MLPLPYSRYRNLAVCGLLGAALMQTAAAQEAVVEEKPETAAVETLPEMVVSAPKLGQDLLSLPLSATVATGEFIEENAVRTVKDAAIYSPNTFFTEFSARKLSNPRFRGIGGSPMNPGVTTYYDGVPQFNGNSSSLELLDVEQVDLIRGPAGALFGRNTVGGLVNVTSRRPSLDSFGGEFETTFGNYNLYDMRGRVSGPLIKDQLGFSFAGGHNERDGYTENTVTGRDLDNRSSYFGKGQLLWAPNDKLEVRFILAGESARDGDYALNDLAELRRNPRQSARDFEGYTERDVIMPTLEVTYHAGSFDLTSTTGFVWWQTEDFTDLDYLAGAPAALAAALPPGTPVPPITTSFLTRKNQEEQRTWTQEFRFSNPEGKPVVINEHTTLSWQAGAFFFYQDYDQATVQNREHLFMDVGFGFFATVVPGNVTTTASNLTDKGLGTYLQSTLTLWDKLDITTGLRWDYEEKDADLRTRSSNTLFPSPAGMAADTFTTSTAQDLSRSFNSLTPQAAISYRVTPDVLGYFSFAGGYKAGGFNAGSPAGTEVYDEEYSWNYELGLKGRALDNRLNFGLALFYTDWQDLQLNVPNGGPATFHIANAGSASSKGIELALNYRPVNGWDLFGSAGWQDTKFSSGSSDNNSFTGTRANIGGNKVPYTPDYTVTVGSQYTLDVGHGYSAYARADVQFIGAYTYDSINGEGQDAYTLANFRVGVRNKRWFLEGFVHNAFDSEYVPMAIPFPGVAASGYAGESGAPVTFGIRAGVKF
jgi:iron complex outermembrane receptor protein